MDIDKAIRVFSDFLNSSWIIVSQLLLNRDYTSNEDSINDWLQANWELLVERKVLRVNEYLEVYGEGADYNGSSSRIVDPEVLPNFKVVTKSRNGDKVLDILNNEQISLGDITFEKLVGFINGFYTFEPEFKYVLLSDDNLGLERVVILEDVVFELEKLQGLSLRREVSQIDNVAKQAKQWLGKDYKVFTNKAGDQIFMSKNGLRKMRFNIKNPL